MRILIVTPAAPGTRHGNRVTALRWARLLRELGHAVAIETEYAGRRADVMVAMHARKSSRAIRRWRREYPTHPLIVALTGTDLYGDLRTSADARRSLEWAARLVVLQRMGVRALPPRHRHKTRVIYQSVPSLLGHVQRRTHSFDVCVIGHLRSVKDPLRAALAVRGLPDSSRVRVFHAGRALRPAMGRRAIAEMRRNPRYRWLSELPRWRAMRLLARCRLLVVSSKAEGGANVVSEAIAMSTPVISSRIPGSIGILGDTYPGYFPVGRTAALRRLLRRAETDRRFYDSLRRRCQRLRPLIDPRREREAWRKLLRELDHG